MIGKHLIGVGGGIIGRMNDPHLVFGRAAVDEDERRRGIGMPTEERCHAFAGMTGRSGHDARPRLFGDRGRVLAEKHRLRQAIGDLRRPNS